MKHKFLITNDVGLAKDKINALIDELQEVESFEDTLDCAEYILKDVLNDLTSALELLGKEVDQ